MPTQVEVVREHPTRVLLLSVAVEVLQDHGRSGFRVDEVLGRTGLTRGALYHHFRNVDDLIDSALVETYARGVQVNIDRLRDAVASATEFEQFRSGILRATAIQESTGDLRAIRSFRAHVMANAHGTMGERLADEQQRLTDELVSVIESGQEKGWVRTDVDALALAVFVQSYSLGAIVDDVSRTHVDAEKWSAVIRRFLDGVVFTPAPHD